MSSPTEDPAARRGADNVARSCLEARPGERVVVLSWRAAPLAQLLADAIEGAGATAVRAPMDALEGMSSPEIERRASDLVGEARATILIAEHGIPPALSMAVLSLARKRALRHLHLTRADVRLFAQSYRAEPELIAELNRRVTTALARANELRARNASGTDVRITLGRELPMIAADGRPTPGHPDNLPSGYIRFHPASVDGVFAPDRGMLGAIRVPRERLRGAPVRFELEAGRVRAVRCEDAALRGELEGYLGSHVNAGRVGLAAVPTNYVVRAESGLEVQDALLPGVSISLGYSDAENTRAPFSCPVQLRLLARKLDVDAGARALIRGGRFESDLVEGIDPFR